MMKHDLEEGELKSEQQPTISQPPAEPMQIELPPPQNPFLNNFIKKEKLHFHHFFIFS